MKKYADHSQFFCGSDEYVLCYPDQNIVEFIPGTNIEFTVERYKEEIGKPYSKIDLYLCNVSNVDSDGNLKVIDDNKVTIHGNSNQTISNQLTHEQNTNTNPTQNTNIPLLLISKSQQKVRQNPCNDKNGSENLFPSINFIQSLTGSYVEDIHRLFESSLVNEEEPCCSKSINPVIERKVYFPIHLVLALSKSMQIYAWKTIAIFSLRDNQNVVMRKNQ